MSTAPVSHRGVWVAPWLGENGETVLLAIDSRRRLVTDPLPVIGTDHVRLATVLWNMLELADPTAPGTVGSAPKAKYVPPDIASRVALSLVE